MTNGDNLFFLIGPVLNKRTALGSETGHTKEDNPTNLFHHLKQKHLVQYNEPKIFYSILLYSKEYHYCRNNLKYCDIIVGPYWPPVQSTSTNMLVFATEVVIIKCLTTSCSSNERRLVDLLLYSCFVLFLTNIVCSFQVALDKSQKRKCKCKSL